MGAAGKNVYVFNETKQCFLCLNVSPAHTHLSRMRGLLGRLRLRRDDGVWVMPSQGIHTIGMLFPIDVVYLDADQRVIHVIEHCRPFRIAPLRVHAKSVLELPTRTIWNSGTEVGDSLLICAPEEMENYWKRQETREAQQRKVTIESQASRQEEARMRQWLARLFAKLKKDKRKSLRIPGGPLVAHYWTGGSPAPRKLPNVSVEGAYIQAPESWYPGTVISLTLQSSIGTSSPEGNGQTSDNGAVISCTVHAVVVRTAADGFGVQFLFGNHDRRVEFQRFLREVLPKEEPRP